MTDDKDRRLLLSLLSTFYCKDIEQDHYHVAPGDTYYIPPHGSYQVRGWGGRGPRPSPRDRRLRAAKGAPGVALSLWTWVHKPFPIFQKAYKTDIVVA